MNNNIIDLFCGAGGLSLGFENAGFESKLAIDFWPPAIETYNANRKNKIGKVFDITKIDDRFLNDNNIVKISGIIGGPPCQGFSMAGKRIIDDDRNKLYRDYFRILEIVDPEFFVMENVVGIININNGAVKEDIIKRANKIGYEIYVKVLCASKYGVPQNRNRVFFVGIKKDIVKNKGEFIFPDEKKYVVSCEDAIDDLPRLTINNNNTYRYAPKNEYQSIMRNNSSVVYNHENTNHTQKTIEAISHVPEGCGMKSLPDSIRGNRNYSSLLRRMDRKKPSHTIDTGHRTYFHYEENRIISVRESARLQSFPDTYIFYGSKQQQYKQVGNAVPPMLAFELAKRIKEYLGDK